METHFISFTCTPHIEENKILFDKGERRCQRCNNIKSIEDYRLENPDGFSYGQTCYECYLTRKEFYSNPEVT